MPGRVGAVFVSCDVGSTDVSAREPASQGPRADNCCAREAPSRADREWGPTAHLPAGVTSPGLLLLSTFRTDVPSRRMTSRRVQHRCFIRCCTRRDVTSRSQPIAPADRTIRVRGTFCKVRGRAATLCGEGAIFALTALCRCSLVFEIVGEPAFFDRQVGEGAQLPCLLTSESQHCW